MIPDGSVPNQSLRLVATIVVPSEGPRVFVAIAKKGGDVVAEARGRDRVPRFALRPRDRLTAGGRSFLLIPSPEEARLVNLVGRAVVPTWRLSWLGRDDAVPGIAVGSDRRKVAMSRGGHVAVGVWGGSLPERRLAPSRVASALRGREGGWTDEACVWSPDGGSVAFAAARSPGVSDGYDRPTTLVWDLRRDGLRVVGPGFPKAWTPQGLWLERSQGQVSSLWRYESAPKGFLVARGAYGFAVSTRGKVVALVGRQTWSVRGVARVSGLLGDRSVSPPVAIDGVDRKEGRNP